MVRLLVLTEKMRQNVTQDVVEIMMISVVAIYMLVIISHTQPLCQFLVQACKIVYSTYSESKFYKNCLKAKKSSGWRLDRVVRMEHM